MDSNLLCKWLVTQILTLVYLEITNVIEKIFFNLYPKCPKEKEVIEY